MHWAALFACFERYLHGLAIETDLGIFVCLLESIYPVRINNFKSE